MNLAVDRGQELASLAGSRAAGVLAKIFGCTVLLDPPRSWHTDASFLPTSFSPDDEWRAAVFADLSGAVEGCAGLVLSRQALKKALRRLVGLSQIEHLDPRARSALCELGNMAISAAAGAFGKLQSGVVVPSVPRLGLDVRQMVGEELERRSGSMPAWIAESELAEGSNGSNLLGIRFVWIPG